ncbi:hypothetical protein ACHAWO_012962 [Cyclotella atomus]|uniref:Uncharacterized protein n=1 Tax=Cyclotella atomus TaxID=382360 RepID=A0ABD3PPY4_9STRA
MGATDSCFISEPTNSLLMKERCLIVMETKKLQCKGGTCLGEVNPTWLKQPGDTAVALFGAGLIAYGGVLCAVGYYRLATGKGKKE